MSRFIDATINLALRLLEVESTYDKPENLKLILDMALDGLRDFPLQQFEQNGVRSVLLANQPGCKNFKYLLNGYLDVVSGLPNQFKPYISGGKLYGRGAQDMKVALAAMITVFKAVANKVNYPLGLQIVTDEEIGGHNGTEYQLEQGITADLVIVGEPSELKLINRAKGVIKANLTALGKPAHGAYPWQGESAILRMAKFLATFELLLNSQVKSDWATTCDVAIISTTNKEFNKVAADCTVQLDIRYIPEEGAAKIIETIQEKLPRGLVLDVLSSAPAQYTSPENPDLKKLAAVLKKQGISQPEKYTGMNGATDGKYFTQRGIPAVIFGVTGSGLHQDKEWASIKSLETYLNVLIGFLAS